MLIHRYALLQLLCIDELRISYGLFDVLFVWERSLSEAFRFLLVPK